MLSPIEMMVCCAMLATPPAIPGDDGLPLQNLSPGQSDALIDQALFAGQASMSPFDSVLMLGPAGGPPASSASMNWMADFRYGWSMTWEPSLQQLAMEVRETATDTTIVDWSVSLEGLSSLIFQVAAEDASVVVDNWVINGEPLGQTLFADATSSRMDLMLDDYDLESSWRLKGNIRFDWEGSLPDSAAAAFSIYGIPVPAPSAVLALVAFALVGSRRRPS
ncbi:MAG: hypothetical protein MK116_08870 [Phycisphaerales bacterium]|nr:hypothetical protein [Phycisphaerales bacterium]